MAERFSHCTMVREVNAAVVGAVKASVLDMRHLTDAERVEKIKEVLVQADKRVRELGADEVLRGGAA